MNQRLNLPLRSGPPWADDGGASGDDRDRGNALPLVLVMMVIVSLIILPTMTYAVTVLRANNVLSEKSHRIETIKGGLRLALAEPAELYKACAGAGETVAVSLADAQFNDMTVSTVCYGIGVAYSRNLNELRKGLVSTQVGSTIPTVLRTPGDEPLMFTPVDPNSSTEWVASTSLASETDKIWLPNLPVHALSPRAPGGTPMAPEFAACTVYFPGTYVDEVTLTGPTFFTSGIYYFERDVRIMSGASVVVGDGAVPGCTSSQEAVFYAENVPSTHNISGLGGTWVLGADSRILVDNATGDVSFRFNSRYASPGDDGDAPSQDVSIVSVNGDLAPDGVTGVDLDVPGSIHVPLSLVGAVDPLAATSRDYKPSRVTPKPKAPAAPSGLAAQAYAGSAKVSWTAPADGGAQITGYVVTASTGQTCSTAGALECVVRGVAGSPTFTVVAANAIGTSPPSVPTPNVAIGGSTLTAPAQPAAPSAVPYAGNVVQVQWSAPTSTAPITRYVVSASPGGATCTLDVTTAFVAPLACNIGGLDPLNLLGYRFSVIATNAVGDSPASSLSPPVLLALGLLPAPPIAGPAPYSASVQPAIIDLNLTGAGNVVVDVPGYVSVPQGRVNVNNPNGLAVRIAGGLLASQIDVVDSRPEPEIGFLDTVVQRKLRIVSTTTEGVETSTAVVQVNQNGAYAVNSWKVQ